MNVSRGYLKKKLENQIITTLFPMLFQPGETYRPIFQTCRKCELGFDENGLRVGNPVPQFKDDFVCTKCEMEERND